MTKNKPSRMERLFPLGEQFFLVCWRGVRGSLGTAGRSEEPFLLELDPAEPLYATVFACPSDFQAFDSLGAESGGCGVEWFGSARPCGAVGLTFPVVAGESHGLAFPQGRLSGSLHRSIPTFPFHKFVDQAEYVEAASNQFPVNSGPLHPENAGHLLPW
jgi:hypothetical protein